jgi:hypothetical protein
MEYVEVNGQWIWKPMIIAPEVDDQQGLGLSFVWEEEIEKPVSTVDNNRQVI